MKKGHGWIIVGVIVLVFGIVFLLIAQMDAELEI